MARQSNGYIKNCYSHVVPSLTETEAVVAAAIDAAKAKGIFTGGSLVVSVQSSTDGAGSNVVSVLTA